MPGHKCHMPGCRAKCPPKWLMCEAHWRMVDAITQAEVYRTVRLRGDNCDATWAPWWRAAHKAICQAMRQSMGEKYHPRIAEYEKKQMDFADYLDSKKQGPASCRSRA